MCEKGNLKIAFIGAGKVGITLGAYFKNNGINVTGYVSKTKASAEQAKRITDTYAYKDMSALVNDADMVFITTQDDKIRTVWDALSKNNLRCKIVCHTSGALSSEVFSGIRDHGGYGCSIHPMYAFSYRNGNTVGIEKAYFTIEGDERIIPEVKSLLSSLGNKVLTIDSDKKALYHLANVMVSNLVLALLSIGDDCIKQSGIEEGMDVLLPLIDNNIRNIGQSGFVGALTGPVERNDIGAVRTHLDAIPKRYGAIYAELSLRLTEIAQRKHHKADYTKMDTVLHDYIS